jgi:hypothetical protein
MSETPAGRLSKSVPAHCTCGVAAQRMRSGDWHRRGTPMRISLAQRLPPAPGWRKAANKPSQELAILLLPDNCHVLHLHRRPALPPTSVLVSRERAPGRTVEFYTLRPVYPSWPLAKNAGVSCVFRRFPRTKHVRKESARKNHACRSFVRVRRTRKNHWKIAACAVGILPLAYVFTSICLIPLFRLVAMDRSQEDTVRAIRAARVSLTG